MTVITTVNAFAQKQVLDSSMHHLRNGSREEWENFSSLPVKPQYVLNFSSEINSTEYTISLRQFDVKQSWQVLLNNRVLSSLLPDGNDMYVYFSISPGLLLQGENELKIVSTSKDIDDIEVGEIVLDPRPTGKVLSEAKVEIEIREAKSNALIPSRVTIVDSKKRLHTSGTVPSNDISIRPGMIYTATGKLSLLLPGGQYTIYAGRGFEYSIDSFQVTLKNNQTVQRVFRLSKEVNTEGWVSCDTHIHTVTHSGHGDASDTERAITIAGEGIELPVITEHNKIFDLSSTRKKLKLDRFYTVIPGNEVTTGVGHFNVFPLDASDPITDFKVKNWTALDTVLGNRKNKIVVLNHGRDLHMGFRPFDPKRHISIAGKNLDNWILPADAMEVVNSGALLSDKQLLINDWFGLMNRGMKITPVGSSDSHDVARYLVGQARTYIKAKDNDPANIPIDEAISHMKEGKVMVSFGLLAAIKVNNQYGPGEVSPAADNNFIEVEVSGPSWIGADSVRLYANGIEIFKERIQNRNNGGVKSNISWLVKKGKQDIFLVALAEGNQNTLPYWPIVKPFQPTSTKWRPYVVGCSGAVWIDMDGDGKGTSAYEYAKRLVDSYSRDLNSLVKQLNQFDEAVTAQAILLLDDQGNILNSRAFSKAKKLANQRTRAAMGKVMQQLIR